MTSSEGTPIVPPSGQGISAGAEPVRPGLEVPAPPASPPPGTLPAPGPRQEAEEGGEEAVPRINPQVENIEAMGTNALPAPAPNIHLLTVVGQIEGHLALPPQNKTTKYEHVIPQLVAVEQDPRIEGLLVVLNTVGGDVEAGLAIAEMIASLSKPSVSLVLGGGHSIGLPIAVSTTFSFIASTATMTIHPIRLTGLVIGVPQTYEYLDKMQERINRFVIAHSRCSAEKLRELMYNTGELARDVGSVVVGKDAVRYGLIGAVGGLREALQKLNELIEARRAGKPVVAGPQVPDLAARTVPVPPGDQEVPPVIAGAPGVAVPRRATAPGLPMAAGFPGTVGGNLLGGMPYRPGGAGALPGPGSLPGPGQPGPGDGARPAAPGAWPAGAVHRPGMGPGPGAPLAGVPPEESGPGPMGYLP